MPKKLHCVSEEYLLKGRLSKVDLLVLTSSDQLLLLMKIFIFLFFFQTSYLIEEVGRTELSLSVRVPCFIPS
jgi:hypothetical protein